MWHVKFYAHFCCIEMPSDAKKRAAQKKKEQAGNRNKKPIAKVNAADENGTSNGTGKEDREITAEGNYIISLFVICKN